MENKKSFIFPFSFSFLWYLQNRWVLIFVCLKCLINYLHPKNLQSCLTLIQIENSRNWHFTLNQKKCQRVSTPLFFLIFYFEDMWLLWMISSWYYMKSYLMLTNMMNMPLVLWYYYINFGLCSQSRVIDVCRIIQLKHNACIWLKISINKDAWPRTY